MQQRDKKEQNGHTVFWVMNMKTDQEMLSSILKTTQMGQVRIRSVLNTSASPAMEQALRSQLQEYDAIEQQAQTIAGAKGWQLRELDPGVRFLSNMMARMKLSYNRSDSKIAAMMVQGNTRGVVKGLKNSHHFKNRDPQISELSQKLLDCEKQNIRQMEGFL